MLLKRLHKGIRFYLLVIKYLFQGDSWVNATDFAHNIVYGFYCDPD